MAMKSPVFSEMSQNMKQAGMARPGGMMSKTATKIASDKGSGWSAMEAALLRKKKPTAKSVPKLAPGGARQFQKLSETSTIPDK